MQGYCKTASTPRPLVHPSQLIYFPFIYQIHDSFHRPLAHCLVNIHAQNPPPH